MKPVQRILMFLDTQRIAKNDFGRTKELKLGGLYQHHFNETFGFPHNGGNDAFATIRTAMSQALVDLPNNLEEDDLHSAIAAQLGFNVEFLNDAVLVAFDCEWDSTCPADKYGNGTRTRTREGKIQPCLILHKHLAFPLMLLHYVLKVVASSPLRFRGMFGMFEIPPNRALELFRLSALLEIPLPQIKRMFAELDQTRQDAL